MQNSCLYNVILTALLIFQLTICFETERQHRYNQNSDFLLHEANGPLRHQQESLQNAQLTHGKRDYVSPSTSSRPLSITSQQTTPKSVTSPQSPDKPNSQGVHSSGKRDYVALSTSPRVPLITSQLTTIKPPYTQPRRDFVNPRFTTAKPIPGDNQHGNVHDLVNFFDNKNIGPSTPKPPSYSSILQGTTKQGSTSGSTKIQQSVTQAPQNLPQGQGPKSYSSIVAGSNKQTTTRPPYFTRAPSPQLPSAIINNNNNNNQGSSTNSPTDAELQTLSEELLRKDVNNAAKYITVNNQEKTTSQSKEDKAPLPLLTISPMVWNTPTIQKLVPLLDNYEKDTLVNEYVTPQEKNEENAFMDAIMSTAVIRHLMSFLRNKGYVTPDPRQQREFLKQLWFGLYSRGKGKISSSGFEHIFVSELKNGEVLGFHNWIFFAREEAANRVNYLGYLKYVTFGDKGAVMKLHFSQNGVDKPVDTMFIGTSPELEIALYSLCFVTRADNDCELKLGNKNVNIISHTFRYRSKNHIGSAYPQI